jgi:transcriptional regulator with XRE-family HTH domain
MDSVVKQLGQRVRALRLERQFSVEDLAALTNVGVEQLLKIERGVSPPSFGSFLSIAHALRVDPLYLMVTPGLNPVHDLLEATRGAPKATVIAMRAACEGLAHGLGKVRRAGD